ncbi:MAG TPA: hypothetical protein VMW38_08255 [Terriglobia bacterium]|nr:hypothetical protein [Terriglobia bacterium]
MERRSSERIYDDSVLNVWGTTQHGKPFFETATINDVSPDGISFYLRTEVRLECVLYVEICPRENDSLAPTPLFSGRARVLRVSADGQGNHAFLVAARFFGPVSPLRELGGTEEFAEELKRAIELDEERRLFSEKNVDDHLC